MCSSTPERAEHKRRKQKAAARPHSACAKLALIKTLFDNARENIKRLEECGLDSDKAASKPKVGAAHGPTVRMVNGKAVIDTSSLVRAAEVDQISHSPRKTVVEAGNNVTRRKHTHSSRWTLAETELFYTALQLFGTDFCMVANFLKQRTREQVKSKYKKESRLCPAKIEYATTTKIEVPREAYQHELTALATAFSASL